MFSPSLIRLPALTCPNISPLLPSSLLPPLSLFARRPHVKDDGAAAAVAATHTIRQLGTSTTRSRNLTGNWPPIRVNLLCLPDEYTKSLWWGIQGLTLFPGRVCVKPPPAAGGSYEEAGSTQLRPGGKLHPVNARTDSRYVVPLCS